MNAAVEAEVEIELLHTDRDKSRRRKKFRIPSCTSVRFTDTRDHRATVERVSQVSAGSSGRWPVDPLRFIYLADADENRNSTVSKICLSRLTVVI